MPANIIARFWNSDSFAGFRTLLHTTLLFTIVLAGCTNLQPVPMENGELQENIRAGTVVHEGDTARIVTRDGVSRSLVVTAVQENSLLGHIHGARTDSILVEIPLDEILTLEIEKEDAGEQAVHLFGSIEILVIIAFILAALG
jgi:hypothetical protein